MCVSQPNLKPVLTELKKLRTAQYDTEEGREWLFMRGWDASHTIRNLFRECGLLEGPDGKSRTAYSLRHTYITDRLINGVASEDIARNCGTSLMQIQKHYDHVLPDDRIAELTQNRGLDAVTILSAMRTLRMFEAGGSFKVSDELEKLWQDAIAQAQAESTSA